MTFLSYFYNEKTATINFITDSLASDQALKPIGFIKDKAEIIYINQQAFILAGTGDLSMLAMLSDNLKAVAKKSGKI